MNRNMQGAKLTTTELVELALTAGLVTAEDVRKLTAKHQKGFHSKMLEVTAKERFRLFMRGQLRLDTRSA